MSVQKMMPALPGAKLCVVIILLTWTAADPSVKMLGPSTAARRRLKLRKAASNPTAAKPRLAVSISIWNGLSAQPMKAADIWPKNTCMTKLYKIRCR